MITQWKPPIKISKRELKILHLCRKQKLWQFLREYRHKLLDEEVRCSLARMYSSTGKGRPKSPEQLALALLLQVAFGVADHEVPTLTVVDQRWRMILGCLHEKGDDPLFSQGTVFHFRERAREHGFMTLLLEKTIALARETKGFSHKRLRAMIDSSPLIGAGRVEDTFNLIGRALKSLIVISASEAKISEQALVQDLALTVMNGSSVKAALDVDWRLPGARNEAINALVEQFERLMSWLKTQFTTEEVTSPPISEAIALVEQLIDQDTEPDPGGPDSEDPCKGKRRIRRGGKDRRVSIHDPDQRHGRKSKSKLFVGYKRHISIDADIPGLVLSVHVAPANIPEYQAAQPLLNEAKAMGFEVQELHIDRGYLSASVVHEQRNKGMRLISKPPTPNSKRKRFGKVDFDVDVENGVVTCCGGHKSKIRETKSGRIATFPRSVCVTCPLSHKCLPKSGYKIIRLHENEALYQQMSRELATEEGRSARRERVAVEHALAKISTIQGNKSRYFGLAKNQFHTEACSVVENCFVLGQLLKHAA